tara:strand:- start:1471 stop:1692 length:222 start_codon:yes stop_codon:yes gene_type:complete
VIVEIFFYLLLFLLSLGSFFLIRNRAQSIDEEKLMQEVDSDFSQEYGEEVLQNSELVINEIVQKIENENNGNQ